MKIIKSFGSIDRLYRKGVNICKGCEREYYGSCGWHCRNNNFADCNEQAARHIQAIKRVTTTRPASVYAKQVKPQQPSAMTPQEYIAANAARFATRQRSANNANKLCKEIQTLCGCTAQEAVKTLIATFDVALKMRNKK